MRSFGRLTWLLFPLLLLAAETGCSGDRQPNVRDRTVASFIELSQTEVEFDALGLKAQIQAIARAENGTEIEEATITWTSSNPTVAEVNAEGVITANANGTAVVTARARNVTATVDVRIEQLPSSLALKPDTLVLGAVGASERLTATVSDRSGHPLRDAEITWRSKEPDTVTVGDDGTVVARAAGSAEIVATVVDTEVSGTATVEVIPLPARAGLFVQAPQRFTSGVPTQVRVEIRDEGGVAVPGAKHEVSIRLGDNPHGGRLSGTLSVNAVDGIATFEDLVLDKAGSGYTLVARVTSLDEAESNSITVIPGAPARLAFSRQPSDATSNLPMSPSVRVEIQDAAGNRVPEASEEVTVALDRNPTDATLRGTLTVSAVNGTASFDNLLVDKAGSGYTLRALSGILEEAHSEGFRVRAGAPARLAFLTQPSDAASNTPLSPAVQVRVLDEAGNPTTSDGSVTIALGQNPSAGTLTGRRSAELIDGIATFDDLRLDMAGEGYTLTASSALLSSVESHGFAIRPGSAAKLAFTREVQAAVSTETLQPGPRVEVQDAAGNRVMGANHAITVSLGENPRGGTLEGTVTVNATDGVATFSNLSIPRAANGYTLVARTQGLQNAESSPFEVAPGEPSRLNFIREPENIEAGHELPMLQVEVLDVNGNRVAQGGTTIILSLQPGGVPLLGTSTATTESGVASFPNLSVQQAGTNYTLHASSPPLGQATSKSFHVAPGAARQLGFLVQPTNTRPLGTISPAVEVEVQDQYGNRVPSSGAPILLSLSPQGSGATLSGGNTRNAIDGVAVFPSLSVDKIGSGYTLVATSSGLADARSNGFSVQGGPARKLVFRNGPQNGEAGQPLPPIRIEVVDEDDNLLTNFSGPVTLALGKHPSGARLDGATTVLAQGGVATFSDLSIRKAGQPYSLLASSGSIEAVESADFEVAPGPVASLRLLGQPANRNAGQYLPPVQIALLDAAGNPSRSNASVSLALLGGDGTVVLDGSHPKSATDGVVTFEDLRIESAGIYSIRAEVSGVDPVTTDLFTISPGLPSELRFLTEPSSGVRGEALAPVRVGVFDAFGNPSDQAVDVTIELRDGNPAANLSGTTTQPTRDGVATFSDLGIDEAGTGYRLRATATGPDAAFSETFDVLRSSGATQSLTFLTQPANGVSGQNLANLRVAVLDAYDQVDTSSTAEISLSIATGPAGARLSGPSSALAAAGVATFAGVQLDLAGTYRLLAHHPTLGSVQSDDFQIVAGDPAQLRLLSQPSNRKAGEILPAIRVAILDAAGNATASTAIVQLELLGGEGGVALQGVTSKAATSGQVDFDDLSVQKVGAYALRASANGIPSPITTDLFHVAAADPAELAFVNQPVDGVKDQMLPAVRVAVLDSYGNPSDADVDVQLQLLGGPGNLDGTLAQQATKGLATFNDLSVDTAGQGYFLRASTSAPAVQDEDSATFSITATTGPTLAFRVQPQNGTSGTALAEVEVAVLDAYGQVDASFSGEIALSIATGPAGAGLKGTSTVQATAGVATFTGLQLDLVGTYRLLAHHPTFGSVQSDAFDIEAGSPAQLRLLTQPADREAGADLPDILVAILDAAGNETDSTATVTLELLGTESGATIHGSRTVAAVSGVATFEKLNVRTVGSYLLRATATGLAPAHSTTFAIHAGAPKKIAFLTQPADAMKGQVLPAIEIALLDEHGNVSDSGLTVELELIGGGGATLGGTTAKAASSGLVGFGDLFVATAGENFQLRAFTQSPSLQELSASFSIAESTAPSLVFHTQPQNGASGVGLASFQVAVRNVFGTIDTSSTAEISLSIASGPSGARLSGSTSVQAIGGLAAFTGLSLDLAGTYRLLAYHPTFGSVQSDAFDIAAGAPAQIRLLSQPADRVAGATLPAIAVAIVDAAGNPTNGTDSIGFELLGGDGSAALHGTHPQAATAGAVTFDDLVVRQAGSYVLRAVSPNASLASATSEPFTIHAGPAAQLAFLTQPVDGMPGQALPPVQVAILDAHGNRSDDGSVVSLQLLGTGGGNLGGTTSKPASAGLVTFDDLAVDAPGQGYTLHASIGSPLLQETSAPFTIHSASSSKSLTFLTQPQDANSGLPLPSIEVALVDENSNIDTSFTGTIELRIASGPAGASLTGTTQVQAIAGVATFGGLGLELAGTYTFMAEAADTPPAISTGFTVFPGAPAHLVFEQGPFNVEAASPMAPAVRVAVLDAAGNLVDEPSATVTLELDTPAGATLLGGSAPLVGGMATFHGLQVDRPGDYMLIAKLGGLGSQPSLPFTVRAGDATQLVITESPNAAIAGESFVVAVELRDAAGNRTTSELPITLTLLPQGSSLRGLTNKTATGGVAHFDGLRIEEMGSAYEIQASAPGLPPVHSAPFDVSAGEAVSIAWIHPPVDTTSGATIGPVEVELRDALGNAVESASDLVSVSLAPTAPSNATLSGTLVATPSQGRALFGDLSIDRAASHYQLLVETAGIGPFASPYFSIAPGAPARLEFFASPTGGRAGSLLDRVAVGILDAAGNLTESTLTVSLSLQGGDANATLGGTTSRGATEGVALFDDLEIDESGAGYVLVASAPGIPTPAQSDPFDLTGGCPSGYSLCGEVCVDLQNNSAHCGACDNDCDGSACVHGTCDTSCPIGMELCDDTCVDLQYDPDHCGACDDSCGSGEICSEGACLPEPDRNQANWPLPPENPTHYVTTSDMVEDRVTGLIWQRSVLAGGTFQWDAAHTYCRNLRIDGRSDWRLPTAIELLSIVDSSVSSPSINQGAFANTPPAYFWTATEVHGDPTRAWYVRFTTGLTSTNAKTATYAVRCVRGGSDRPGPRYDLTAETVTDNKTGLTWARYADGTLRYHAEAEAYCASLDIDGEKWRLPTKKELESIVDWRNASPAFDGSLFPGIASSWYLWTQTPSTGTYSPYWAVYARDGNSLTRDTGGTGSTPQRHQTICVLDDTPGDLACAGGEVQCGSECVDLQDHTSHCGACNITCGPGEVCSTGICTAEVDYDWANWELPPEAPSDYQWDQEIVTDQVTGLIWQREVLTGTFSWEDAQTYCRQVGTGGHTDWRLPAQAELLTLINSNAASPAIHSAAFPLTPSGRFWSATSARSDESQAWFVSFSDSTTGTIAKTTMYYVRCVRGGDSFNGTRYAIGDETVLDLRTGLEWQREAMRSTLSLDNAETYCSTLGVGGYDNWRLPTKKELESIVDRRVQSPSIYANAFLGTIGSSSGYYWTSTPRANDTSQTWRVQFSTGASGTTTNSTASYVRCVRDPIDGPVSCSGGLTHCGGGACVDLDTDPSFCGACAVRCAEGERCEAGSCQPLPDFEMASWDLPPEAPTNYSPGLLSVEDQVTGLVWQRGTIPGNNFRWDDAVAYCRNLRLDDKSDWRLPTAMELLSIISSNVRAPAINTSAFVSQSSYFWSSTENADSPDQAWRINFADGAAAWNVNKTNTYAVRCVRMGDGPSGPRYEVEPEVVRDTETGLVWQRHALSTTFSQAQAQTYCSGLGAGGYTDWRVPTKKELESLVDRRTSSPVFAPAFTGPMGSSNYYWTGTLAVGQSNSPYWRVQATTGVTSTANTTGTSSSIGYHQVRCVRDPTPDPQSCTGHLDICGNVCVDLETDPNNCGSCGTACDAGEQCAAGTCEELPSYEWATWDLPPEAPPTEAYDQSLQSVTDTTTGLIWQRAMLAGVGMNWHDANAYCSSLSLDGHRDWRLPSVMELLSIVSTGRTNPAINNEVFLGTPNGGVWSGTRLATDPNRAWYVNFGSGATSDNTLSTSYGVRCVRGGTAGTGPRYDFDVEEEIVRDLGTGLIWQRHVLGTAFSQADAATFCATLGAGGYDDWRLPTKRELESIVDRSRGAPTFDPEAFPGLGTTWYFWTGTQSSSTNYWRVYAYNGRSSTVATTGSSPGAHQVRCVREPTPDPSSCPGSQVACDNVCADLDTDPLHCGACGNACESGTYCAAGSCIPEPDRNHVTWTIPAEAPDATDYDDSDGETVSDLVTGLVWQKELIPAAVFTQQDAERYCRSLGLGGHRDWRLPTIVELLSIVDQSETAPAFHPVFGQGPTGTQYLWSATSYAGSSSYWRLNTNNGATAYTSTSTGSYARCVRSGTNASPAPYTDIGLETVTDPNTGLMWERIAGPSLPQEDSADYCATLTKGGYADWRLPTKKELESLVDWSRTSPAFDNSTAPDMQALFQGHTTNYYWSSSPYLDDPGHTNAWRVYFSTGASGTTSRTTSYSVRCVRDAGP